MGGNSIEGMVLNDRTDDKGAFAIRDVRAGALFAGDPEGLAGCRAAGKNVDVQESGEQNVELKVKSVAKR